jgi:hypothetical protein
VQSALLKFEGCWQNKGLTMLYAIAALLFLLVWHSKNI